MPEKCNCGKDLCDTCKVCHDCEDMRQVLFNSLPEHMPMELKMFIMATVTLRRVTVEELREISKEDLARIPVQGPVQ